MAHIEVFADIVCPFTHVGLRRLSEALAGANSPNSIVVRAWPLEWINGAPLSAALATPEIEALRAHVAPELFAGFVPTAFPSTSIPAFGLVAAAYASGDSTGQAVSLAVREALFEHGSNVGDPAELAKIARSFAIEMPERAETEDSVRADWERGKARGVLGSPHFFVGNRGWFCPSLDILHEGGRFDVRLARDTMRDFYVAAVA